ncbi:MAG: phosphotransferase [Sandaracinus sp.]|nr:phosphotransferase [Sandaracinus sp.]
MVSPPPDVLSRWRLAEARVEPVAIGLINLTFRVESGSRRFALQRLHPVFRGEVNADIDRITAHLAAKGLVTPRVVPTHDGALWHDAEDGPWRVLTWVDGETVERSEERARFASAGAHVARFHGALADLQHSFAFTRPGAHDTDAHLARLAAALAEHVAHDRREEIAPIAEAIVTHSRPVMPTLATRIVHGDLKLSNVRFDHGGRAISLVDLDTLQHGTLAVELGDALRSWCNPRGEDVERAGVHLGIFEAAVRGYAAEASAALRDDRRGIVPGLETIALELASRFCLDAFEERYFRWDAARFSRASEHHLLRARGQLALARDVASQRDALEEIVDRAFG